jgi:hypothetical protein
MKRRQKEEENGEKCVPIVRDELGKRPGTIIFYLLIFFPRLHSGMKIWLQYFISFQQQTNG